LELWQKLQPEREAALAPRLLARWGAPKVAQSGHVYLPLAHMATQEQLEELQRAPTPMRALGAPAAMGPQWGLAVVVVLGALVAWHRLVGLVVALSIWVL
jgi:hypothetical protein